MRFIFIFIKICNVLIFSFILLFITSKCSFAYFLENFDGGFTNSNVWNVHNVESLSFTSSAMNLLPVYTNRIAFIDSNTSVISPDDSEIEINFEYLSAGGFGDGIGITDINPPFGTVMNYPSTFSQYTMFYVWQNSSSPFFHIVTFLCPVSNPSCDSSSPTIIYSSATVDTSVHTVKLTKSFNTYSVYLDGNPIFTSAETTRIARNVWFGHPETTNTGNSWSSLSVNYFRSGVYIPATFPYYSQKDPVWKDIEYDSASGWAEGDSTIGRWGCAITSVSMLLKNYGINDPSGAEATPDKLNTWLIGEPDGYIAGGLLNWLAVTRYAHEAYVAGKATSELEYSRGSGIPPTLPAIVNEGTHFVVAHASESAQLAINDPNDEGRTTKNLTDYFGTNHSFSPSFTDLSYFLFIGVADWVVQLTDELGNIVPIDWQSEILSGTDGATGPSALIGLVRKPVSGKYHLQIDTPTSGSGELLLYDSAGFVEKEPLDTSTGRNDWEIIFDKNSLPETSTTPVDLTAPPIPILIAPTNGAVRDTAGLVLDWSDVADPSSPVTYRYKSSWDGGSYGPVGTGTNSYIVANGSPEHVYQWQASACDSIGNCSEWSAPYTLTVDNTAPTVSPPNTSPNPTNASTQTWTWLPAVDTSGGVEGYSSRTYDVKINNYFDEWLWLGNVLGVNTSLVEGSWRLDLKARDRAGNESLVVQSANLVVDTTAPSVNLDVWGRTLSGTASDNLSGVERVEIRLTKPGETEGTFTAVGTTDWSYTITDAKLGWYKAIITAVDNAGNKSSEVTKEYEIAATDTVSSTPEPEEPTPSDMPAPSVGPTSSPVGIVLGEESKKVKTNYWWLVLIPLSSWIVYWLARRRRN